MIYKIKSWLTFFFILGLTLSLLVSGVYGLINFPWFIAAPLIVTWVSAVSYSAVYIYERVS